MNSIDKSALSDQTPIIVGAAQHVVRLTPDSSPPFESPMELAAIASRVALKEAGVTSDLIDTIAVIRLFSDAAKAWASPFGGSNNPPESVARHLSAEPRDRIYSNAGGTQPLQLLMEMFRDIGRGEREVILLTGAEAIASQRHALRNDMEVDWSETFDVPMDNREYKQRFVNREEIKSGLHMPAHFYALIENRQAHDMGHTTDGHRRYMAELMAPFSKVAEGNRYAQKPVSYDVASLMNVEGGNYMISHPLSRLLVAQDAVNQSAALVLTSAGKARELGIDEARWITVDAYAEGEDRYLCERKDVGRSEAMEAVFQATLDMADATLDDMDAIDLYSCFPCAIHAACRALDISTDYPSPLTVTGGLPFFGGPGNNYVMHALVEMCARLQSGARQTLVTGNGGIFSKHAAVVLRTSKSSRRAIDWSQFDITRFEPDDFVALEIAASPTQGTIVSHTVIANRNGDDVAVVIAEDDSRNRFLASSDDQAVATALSSADMIGEAISVTSTEDGRRHFELHTG